MRTKDNMLIFGCFRFWRYKATFKQQSTGNKFYVELDYLAAFSSATGFWLMNTVYEDKKQHANFRVFPFLKVQSNV